MRVKILFFLFILIFAFNNVAYAQTATPTMSPTPVATSTPYPTPTPLPNAPTGGPPNIGNIVDGIDQSGKDGTLGNRCARPSSDVVALPVPNLDWPDFLKGFMNNVIGAVNGVVMPLLSSVMPQVVTSMNQFRGETLCTSGKPSNLQDINQCICQDPAIFKLANLCAPLRWKTDRQTGTLVESKDLREYNSCVKCGYTGIWTGIGCVDFKLNDFIQKKVFGYGLGLGGVLTMFCIIFAAFQIQISNGNPEKIKKAQEMLTSCVIGLLVIIFSVFILRVIGVDLLRIPGFK